MCLHNGRSSLCNFISVLIFQLRISFNLTRLVLIAIAKEHKCWQWTHFHSSTSVLECHIYCNYLLLDYLKGLFSLLCNIQWCYKRNLYFLFKEETFLWNRNNNTCIYRNICKCKLNWFEPFHIVWWNDTFYAKFVTYFIFCFAHFTLN